MFWDHITLKKLLITQLGHFAERAAQKYYMYAVDDLDPRGVLPRTRSR